MTKKRVPCILVVGLEHVLPKQAVQAEALAKRGIRTVYYARDIWNLTETTKKMFPIEFVKAPNNIILACFCYLWLLLKYRPKHVEIFFCMDWIPVYAILTFITRIPLVFICRGGELLYWKQHRMSTRIILSLLFKLSKIIICTEYFMEEMIRRYHIFDLKKFFFFHNRTKVYKDYTIERDEKIILFLNSFKAWRHPELIIQAVPLVIKRFPDAKFVLVGVTNISPRTQVEERVRQLIKELEIEDNVKIEPFTDNPWKYYEMSSIFVLPADIVFCNFSLIEAMERGIPPIVSNIGGSERIIEHRVNGLIVPQTPQDIADAIILLLDDEQLRRRMGEAARATILQQYDIDEGSKILENLYKEKIWR